MDVRKLSSKMSGASGMKQSASTQILDLPSFLSPEGDDGNIAYSNGIIFYRTSSVWEPLLGFDQIRAGNNIVITSNLTTLTISTGDGVGDVSGPGLSVDNAVARFDGTSGKIIQNSATTLDDIGNLSLGGSISGQNANLAGSLFGQNATLSNQLTAANVSTFRLVVEKVERNPGTSGGTIDFSGILASNFRLQRNSTTLAAASITIFDSGIPGVSDPGALSPQPTPAFPVTLLLRKFGTTVNASLSSIIYDAPLVPDPAQTTAQFIIVTFNIPPDFVAAWSMVLNLAVPQVGFANNRVGCIFQSIIQRGVNAPVGYTSAAIEGDINNPLMSIVIGYAGVILGGKVRIGIENYDFTYHTHESIATFL